MMPWVCTHKRGRKVKDRTLLVQAELVERLYGSLLEPLCLMARLVTRPRVILNFGEKWESGLNTRFARETRRTRMQRVLRVTRVTRYWQMRAATPRRDTTVSSWKLSLSFYSTCIFCSFLFIVFLKFVLCMQILYFTLMFKWTRRRNHSFLKIAKSGRFHWRCGFLNSLFKKRATT